MTHLLRLPLPHLPQRLHLLLMLNPQKPRLLLHPQLHPLLHLLRLLNRQKRTKQAFARQKSRRESAFLFSVSFNAHTISRQPSPSCWFATAIQPLLQFSTALSAVTASSRVLFLRLRCAATMCCRRR